jgi:hypothetical protein
MRLEGILPKSRYLRNTFRETLFELTPEGDKAECPHEDLSNGPLTFDNVRVEACPAPSDTATALSKVE